MIASRLMRPVDAVPVIVSLEEHFESIRQGEIDRFRGRLGRLSPEQQNAVESLTHAIVNRILHPAMTVLKTTSDERESTLFPDMVLRIFNLGEKREPERRAMKIISELASTQPSPEPIDLDLTNRVMYWTDVATRRAAIP
jgi:hypothetical protein